MNSLQSVILAIFKEIDSLCARHGIPYFAIGGTAIGAARHEGFIPWDDDLDIAIPVEHYGRFLSLAKEELPKKYKITNWENGAHYAHVFSKVEDATTTVIEPCLLDYPDSYTGVWVDIMPMSGIPSGRARQKTFISSVRLMRSLDAKMKMPYPRTSSFASKLIWIALFPFKNVLSRNFFVNLWCRFLSTHPFSVAQYTGYTWSDCRKLVFPKEWFSDYILMPFEDTQIRMPVGYHEYLTQQFGDYMTVPPPEQQVTHSGFVDLEHSYKDYQSGKLRIPEGYFEGR